MRNVSKSSTEILIIILVSFAPISSLDALNLRHNNHRCYSNVASSDSNSPSISRIIHPAYASFRGECMSSSRRNTRMMTTTTTTRMESLWLLLPYSRGQETSAILRMQASSYHHQQREEEEEEDNNNDHSNDSLSSGKKSKRRQTNENQNSSDDDDDDEEEEDVNVDSILDSITDEEVILASRAYLQRKNRLKRPEQEKRKQMAKRASALFRTANAGAPSDAEGEGGGVGVTIDDGGNDGTGYFWENPDELIYLRHGSPLKFFNDSASGDISWIDDGTEMYNDPFEDRGSSGRRRPGRRKGVSDEAEYMRNSHFSGPGSRKGAVFDEDDNHIYGNNEADGYDFTVDDDDDNNDGVVGREEGEGGEFTSFPLYPPPERVRRSQAAKRTWSNPKWRAQWYEKRWKGRTKSEQDIKQQKLIDRVRSVPTEILRSEELAALSEEELTEAIQTYVQANRKRSKARKQWEENRKHQRATWIEKEETEFQHEMTEEQMLEAQQRRSERAAKAYQTRIKNQEKKKKRLIDRDSGNSLKNRRNWKRKRQEKLGTPVSSSPVIPWQVSMTSREALTRIEVDLNSGILPSPNDVKLILKPGRLGRRRDVMRRILSDCFDLRGKCVPLHPWMGDDSPKEFVTQCPLEELGAFVISKLEEAEEDS